MTLTALPLTTGPLPAVGYASAPSAPARADDVSPAVARLAREFAGRVPHRVVARVVRECRADLSGVPAGAVPELLERLARQRLLDRADRRVAAKSLPPNGS
ncbi:hypothetical protein LWC35_16205 [Pseudonocardia kujensis]|uniref:hypothetical protein n=1 Tax=Pseudonocardia kujensis TaxID=1128675 RepID=UPI001E2CFB68|nr:hypothetical protein [Pseudonocardia kujensis]MCE0764438.1 hypothetical protein [Pseudonocardia kujensis]